MRSGLRRANFVDLDAITVDRKVEEALDLQGDDEGGPGLDFLSTEWKKELVVEMGGLVGDLPDLGEIVHSKGFFCERKGVGVEGDKNEGPGTPQDTPNVENVEIFDLGGHFASTPVTHEIGAAEGVRISQEVFGVPSNVGERTLEPTKHPPGHAATHSNDDPILLYQYKQVMAVTVYQYK
jgi:hypothetical protein